MNEKREEAKVDYRPDTLQAKTWRDDPRLANPSVYPHTATATAMTTATTTYVPPFVAAGVAGAGVSRYFPDGDIGKHMKYTEFDPVEIDTAVANVDMDWLAQAQKKKHAYTFLETAVKEMKDRAIQRDTQQETNGKGGERSMASTVKAFNALTGHNLTEAEGWEFMILLKLVRGRQGEFRMDDYVDAAAYAALLGECESTAR